MSDNLEIRDLQNLIKLPTTQLKDYAGEQILVNSSVEEPLSFSAYDSKLTLSGAASIELFNSKDDKDSVNVLGQTVTKVGDFQLLPSINYSADQCWLKYSINADIKGSASHSLEELGFGIDLEAGLYLYSYRSHEPTAQLLDALSSDLATPKLIVSTDDISSLESNEAVAMETKGKLTVSMKLNWSDVLTQNMSLFSKLLSAGELLNLKIGAEVSSSIKVTIEDYFSLAFSGVIDSNERIRLRLLKSEKRGVDFKAGAKITAEFADPDTLKKVTSEMLEGVLDTPKDTIDKLKTATDISQLNDIEKKAVETILSRLGLDTIATSIEELASKIDELESEISEKLGSAIESKATLGVTYEYGRLKNEQSLLQGSIPKTLVQACHEEAIKGRLFALTQVLEDESNDATLERFFFQKSTTIKQAFGFNLGFGNWEAMSRDYSDVTFVENRDAQKRLKLSMMGARGYKSYWGEDNKNFFIDFDAVMPNYSDSKIPTADEFEYALNISHLREEDNLTKRELFGVVESASVWGIVPQGELDDTVEELWEDLEGSRNIKIIRTMTLQHELFLKLLPQMADHNPEDFAISLAASLSSVDRGREEVKEVRNSLYLRRKLYFPLCLAVLDGTIDDYSRLAKAAHNHLKSEGYRKLARWELNWLNNARRDSTIAGTFRLHPNLRRDLLNFSDGMKTLKDAIHNSKSHTNILKSFKMFDDMGKQGFYMRMMGHYLMRMVKSISDGEEFECALTIEYTPVDTEEAKKLVVSAS